MGTARKALATLTCAASVLVAAGGAAAQTDAELERAREQFAEGLELADAERWAEAAERFRAVLEVKATPQVRFNLAQALAETGELARAAELLEQVEANPEAGRRMAREAKRTRESIEPRLARLRVSVTGDAAGAAVTLDGEELPPEDWDRAIPVDPGTHELVLTGRGRQPSSRTVMVEEGGSAEVQLVPGPEEAARSVIDPELVGTPERVDEGEDDEGGIASSWWLWTAVGVVVVVVAVGVGVAAAGGGTPSPQQGDLDPSILEVRP